MEKIVVTQALWERKNLKDRIKKAIAEGVFMGIVEGDNLKPSNREFKTANDLSAKIQSSTDKARGLISRYHRIVAALLAFNAKTTVTIAGETMTVAQAIERRESHQFELDLLKTIQVQKAGLLREIGVKETTLRRDIEARVANNKTDNMDAEEIKKVQEEAESTLTKQRQPQLFDPAKNAEGYEEQMARLQTFIDTIEVELNVVNAINSIDV